VKNKVEGCFQRAVGCLAIIVLDLLFVGWALEYMAGWMMNRSWVGLLNTWRAG
jgi:uncharacterized membrane protein